MESLPTNPIPDIPKGFEYHQEEEKPTPEEVEDALTPSMLDEAEAYARGIEAEWDGKETKARILHLALEIPQPYDAETLNTCHPFWTVKEFTDLKTHYLQFLLSL